VYRGDVRFVWVRIPVEFCSDDAGGHCWNGDLFGGTNGIHLLVGELDLPGVHIVDQFVAVHEVDANNVVVQLVDDVHRVSELLPFDIEVYLIDPNGIHCFSGSGDAALRVGDFLWFLVSKCGIEGSAVHASDGCFCVK
jgi:hypothetical protein